MSRFHQRLNEDLRDPEFAEAFCDMSVDIALLQVLEQARKVLNVSEKELVGLLHTKPILLLVHLRTEKNT